MEVDQQENQTRIKEDQLGYGCNNSGAAKRLKEHDNRGRTKEGSSEN